MKNIAPFGPTPTRTAADLPVEALDASRQRLLRLLLDQPGTASSTLRELVASVGGHPNTTRHHLRVLVDAGLVLEQRTPPAGGRGRPATRYAVTARGRRAGASLPQGSAAQEYVALAAAFAERLAERDGDPGDDARAIGWSWGAGLAARHAVDEAPSRPAREQVVALLDRLGFSPAVEVEVDSELETGAQVAHETGPETREPAGPVASSGEATTVLLRTCPLLDAARRHPEVVCQVHLGLVSGALEAHGEPSVGVGLVPFARPGACELVLPPTLVR